jgi:hypothetical protein
LSDGDLTLSTQSIADKMHSEAFVPERPNEITVVNGGVG